MFKNRSNCPNITSQYIRFERVFLERMMNWHGLNLFSVQQTNSKMKVQQSRAKVEDSWVLRIYTDDSRFRLELFPSDPYQVVLDFICNKTQLEEQDFEVFSPNGRKLNIPQTRRVKDVVYLSHGSILQVKLLKPAKISAFNERTSFLSGESKVSFRTQISPLKSKCNHPLNGRCFHCDENFKKDPFAGTGQLIYDIPPQEVKACVHGLNKGCLKCLRQVKSAQKIQVLSSISSPRRNRNNPELVTPCKHKTSVTCNKCEAKAQKIKSIALLKEPSTFRPPQSLLEQEKGEKKDKEDLKKCNHGQNARCIHCSVSPKKASQSVLYGHCQHKSEDRCINCLPQKPSKATFLPFDEYLSIRRQKCSHSSSSQCPNCLPPSNLRLTIDTKCKRHAPYPEALCSACEPQSVTVAAQKYRHVDYVQFMNNEQMHNFVGSWMSERSHQIRVGFLYGYFTEDPFFKNGIRAIVEAIYEPHQYCTSSQFYILDGEKRKSHLKSVSQSLKLEKIGMILATPNDGECPLTEQQVRVIAKIQQKQSITHSTGYKMSNFFTVIIRKSKDPQKPIEPEVFMVSDQGQALEAAGMFVQNRKHTFQMKLKSSKGSVEPLPSIMVGGKEVEEFEIEYLLVKVGAGVGKSKKFAILKNNMFPPSSRGNVKAQQIKSYVAKTKFQPSLVRFGDFNLLLFIAEVIDVETAKEIGSSMSDEREVEESVWQMVDAALGRLVG